jgi:hypothetical protein
MGLLDWWRRRKMRRYVKKLRVIPPLQRLSDDDLVDTGAFHEPPWAQPAPRATRASIPLIVLEGLDSPELAPLARRLPPVRDLTKTVAVPLPDTLGDLPAPSDGLGLLDQYTVAAPLGYADFAADSGGDLEKTIVDDGSSGGSDGGGSGSGDL